MRAVCTGAARATTEASEAHPYVHCHCRSLAGGGRVDVEIIQMICALTHFVPAVPAGRASIPPTRPCASPIYPPVWWSPVKMRNPRSRTGRGPCACCGPGSWIRRNSSNGREVADARRSQVGSGDRSERIRTYNYPQNRVSDHRIGFTTHRLEAILDGDLEEIIDNLVLADQTAKLAALEA